MRLLDFIRSSPRPQTAAGVAKERLQIAVAYDRAGTDRPDFLPGLQREIMKVVARYCSVNEDLLSIHVERVGESSMLEINVELPNNRLPAASVQR